MESLEEEKYIHGTGQEHGSFYISDRNILNALNSNSLVKSKK